ncbi:hypothetical protein [Pseudarthrobacter sp. NPDC058119]|uniref:hypothetical protein n=1 Tax=Pseudarthrobacter sp. NPDC058119 TaxID=3346348 RepID=UPI0036DF997B
MNRGAGTYGIDILSRLGLTDIDMLTNLGGEVLTEDWEPRIGQEATQTLKSAYQFIRLFFVAWAVLLVVPVAAMISRTIPVWFSIVIMVSLIVLFSVTVLAFGTFSIRRKRAGRQAWEYLGRPPQLHQRRVLRYAMRDPEVFDNYLAEKGISPRGNYPSLASPHSIAKGKGIHQ